MKQASDRKIGNHEYNIGIPSQFQLEEGLHSIILKLDGSVEHGLSASSYVDGSTT